MVDPVSFNINLRRNADTIEDWYFSEAGVPVDFSGYSAELELRRYHGAPGDPLLTLTTATGDSQGIRVNLGGGVIRFWLDWETANGLPPAPVRGGIASFSFDLLLTTPLGIREVWAQGDALVDAGVTVGG